MTALTRFVFVSLGMLGGAMCLGNALTARAPDREIYAGLSFLQFGIAGVAILNRRNR
jgi:hypothetical protein